MTRLALSFLAAALLFGQSGATITGTITDQNGAVVPNVKVEVLNLFTKTVYAGGASQTGNFVIPLPPGTYSMVVEQPGFMKLNKTDLQVEENTPLRVDIRLMPKRLMPGAPPPPPLLRPIPPTGVILRPTPTI